MDRSSYYSLGSSESKMEHMPETDMFTTTGWNDAMFVQRTTPFSPVMSDTNQSAYTLATSDMSFPPLGPSVTQEMPIMDTFLPGTWTPEPSNNYFYPEPIVNESATFAFPTLDSGSTQNTYDACYDPLDPCFVMNDPGQSLTQSMPQTAGFVGDPDVVVPLHGFGNSQSYTGRVRVDSLYTQACPRGDTVSHNSIFRGSPNQDIAGPHRTTVPGSLDKPGQIARFHNREHDVPYGAPIQQYRTYPVKMAYTRHSEAPVLESDTLISTTGSFVPSAYEAGPASPDSSNVTTRLSNEDNDGRARTDPLYSARPGKDGNYHCPFVAVEKCGHKATKLKCNYECVSLCIVMSKH
jgi:hypothetical protein